MIISVIQSLLFYVDSQSAASFTNVATFRPISTSGCTPPLYRSPLVPAARYLTRRQATLGRTTPHCPVHRIAEPLASSDHVAPRQTPPGNSTTGRSTSSSLVGYGDLEQCHKNLLDSCLNAPNLLAQHYGFKVKPNAMPTAADTTSATPSGATIASVTSATPSGATIASVTSATPSGDNIASVTSSTPGIPNVRSTRGHRRRGTTTTSPAVVRKKQRKVSRATPAKPPKGRRTTAVVVADATEASTLATGQAASRTSTSTPDRGSGSADRWSPLYPAASRADVASTKSAFRAFKAPLTGLTATEYMCSLSETGRIDNIFLDTIAGLAGFGESSRTGS